MKRNCILVFFSLTISVVLTAQSFTASTTRPVVYEMLEFKLQLPKTEVANPFTDANLSAIITTPTGKEMNITGFCDA